MQPKLLDHPGYDLEPDWDIDTVRASFGGSRPLDRATIYRAVRRGHIPKPYKVGSVLSRWVSSECRAARRAMIERRTGR
jgi:hypothetical protein